MSSIMEFHDEIMEVLLNMLNAARIWMWDHKLNITVCSWCLRFNTHLNTHAFKGEAIVDFVRLYYFAKRNEMEWKFHRPLLK